MDSDSGAIPNVHYLVSFGDPLTPGGLKVTELIFSYEGIYFHGTSLATLLKYGVDARRGPYSLLREYAVVHMVYEKRKRYTQSTVYNSIWCSAGSTLIGEERVQTML